MQTLKMQVYFMDHAIDKHQIIERHRDRLLAKTQPLTKDIINSNSHSKHDDNIFFRKIAMDIIVQHSLGSPSKPEVEHHLIKNNGIKKNITGMAGHGHRCSPLFSSHGSLFTFFSFLIAETGHSGDVKRVKKRNVKK